MTKMRIKYPLRKWIEDIENKLHKGEVESGKSHTDIDAIEEAQRALERLAVAAYYEWLNLQQIKEAKENPEGFNITAMPEPEIETEDKYIEFVEFNSCPRGGCPS